MTNQIEYPQTSQEDNTVNRGPALTLMQQWKFRSATERVRTAQEELANAISELSALQNMCPHNNVRQDIGTDGYICQDCGSDRVDYAPPKLDK